MENINELSKKTLGTYVRRANGDVTTKAYFMGKDAEREINDNPTGIKKFYSDREKSRTEKTMRNRARGIKRALNRLTKEDMNESVDHEAAHELKLYADNDSHLYHSSQTPIQKNLSKKHKKGVYDSEKAKKLWGYHADRAAQKYHKEHGAPGTKWHHAFSPATRKAVAHHLEKEWHSEMKAGNYHEDMETEMNTSMIIESLKYNRMQDASDLVHSIMSEMAESILDETYELVGENILRDEAEEELNITEEEFLEFLNSLDEEEFENFLEEVDVSVDELEAITEENGNPVEYLFEISKSKLARYINSASSEKSFHAHTSGFRQGLEYPKPGEKSGKRSPERLQQMDRENKRHSKRSAGIQRAVHKLANDDGYGWKPKVKATNEEKDCDDDKDDDDKKMDFKSDKKGKKSDKIMIDGKVVREEKKIRVTLKDAKGRTSTKRFDSHDHFDRWNDSTEASNYDILHVKK